MDKYDKSVVAKRFRERRRRRENESGLASDRMINLFLGLFVIGAVILLAVVIIAFLD